MKRPSHSLSHLASRWRKGALVASLAALVAVPVVGYCTDVDLARPEGIIAYSMQVGVDNTSHITQSNGPNQVAYVLQYGVGNRARTWQSGTNNTAVAMQYGYGNEAAIYQLGVNNYAAVHQIGAGNGAIVGQYGSNQHLTVNQIGFGNKAFVVQVGSGTQPQTLNMVGIGTRKLMIVR